MDKPVIRLYLAGRFWMSDCSRAIDAADTRRLFGTDQIPTPFTAQADPATVRAAIAALNPDHIVTVNTF